MHFLLRTRPVLDAARDNEQVTFLKLNGLVAQVDLERSLEDEEDVLRIAVAVPDKITLELR
jgi:hypothetical protein